MSYLDDRRGTGRTTRMLVACLEDLLGSSCNRFEKEWVICGMNKDHTRSLLECFVEVLESRGFGEVSKVCRRHNSLQVSLFGKTVHFVPFVEGRVLGPGLTKNAGLYVDHAAYERAYDRVLKDMHRWDEDFARRWVDMV